MRLIDADALSEWLKDYGQKVIKGERKISLMYIWKHVQDMPTIEPERKSGTWILQDGGKATCPFCQHTFRDVWDDDSCDSFCRRCGAKLEGVEQE